MATIAILGTMDTKGAEHAFIQSLIAARGFDTYLIDVGTGGPPQIEPDLSSADVAEGANIDLAPILARRDRGEAVTAMSQAVEHIIPALARAGRIHGIISLGGGGGTSISTAAMRALPLGFPKVMVSTVASGQTHPYVGASDTVLFPSITDIAGLNSISRIIFTRAVGAICGMVDITIPEVTDDKPIIVASMFGNTTECVNHARKSLEEKGYEVLVFHATGTGGRVLESLVSSGKIAGVLDITTTELADEVGGGVLSAGKDRLNAAGITGTPTIVTPGCLDMINFQETSTIPECFAQRLFYPHNPQVTLMRTNVEESEILGKLIAEKLNAYTGPVTFLIPTKGFSTIGAPGNLFHNPESDQAFITTLKKHLSPSIPVVELDLTINTPEFAEACCAHLLQLILDHADRPA